MVFGHFSIVRGGCNRPDMISCAVRSNLFSLAQSKHQGGRSDFTRIAMAPDRASSLQLDVHLPSGRGCVISLAPESLVSVLKATAQRHFQRRCLRLTAKGGGGWQSGSFVLGGGWGQEQRWKWG